MKISALLPMKGHSERVSNKNMKLFAGEPLYHKIMNALLNCKYIDEIIINTDSQEIKKDALKNYNIRVKIIDRPEKIQGDFISMNEIIRYDLEQIGEEHFLQTHSTNPLLTVKTLNEAIEQYFDTLNVYDSLFSVTRLQTRLYRENGEPVNHNPEELLRTQDLPPVFEENSNFYIFSRSSFIKSGNRRIGTKPQMFEVNKLDAIDIDEPEDFTIAELLYKLRRGSA